MEGIVRHQISYIIFLMLVFHSVNFIDNFWMVEMKIQKLEIYFKNESIT